MTLRQIMNMIVVNALVSDGQLTPTDVKVYLHMYNSPIASMRAHAQSSRIPRETLRRSARHLIEIGWADELPQAGKVRPMIAPSMPLDVEQTIANELVRVRDEVLNYGEWLMKCILDLMVADNDYHDNARPSWLASGDGGSRLEIDRWYRSARVAFEFQGPHHYRVGGPYAPTEAGLLQQMTNDNLKAGVCAREGIRIVEITAKDLHYHNMSSKISGLLPLAPVRHDRPIFRTLSKMCQSYINYAAREEKRAQANDR